MNTIRIEKVSITDLTTDAIVNAANERLQVGGGVCGAIFRAAGNSQLQDACDKIGYCNTGSAVITLGFNMKAKYIIHAVGPVWSGGNHDEPKYLYGAYRRTLELAVENNCISIGFPLISAGIFGYPVDQAWRKAIQACRDFLEKGNQIDIVFAVLDDHILKMGQKTLVDIAPQFAVNDDGNDTHPNRKTVPDELWIGGRKQDAIFFHKPEEAYGFLSNWYLSDFVLDGQKYTSNEQYIMYQKCLVCGDAASAASVLQTDDVAKQQMIAKKAKGYQDHVWAGMRQLAAMRGLMAKFSQNTGLKQKLLDTGDVYLVECAKSDKVWACGVSLNDDQRCDTANWTGQNILGFALMEVREIIKNQI